jgi:tetratricopeptide (TPR) repeat protein
MKARLRVAALVWLIALVEPLVAQDDRLPERLREVARLPKIDVGMELTDGKAFDRVTGEFSLKTSQAALDGTGADGERYLQIATAHRSGDRSEQAEEAYLRAIEIFRRRFAANSNDVSALIGLGRTVTNRDEAEQLLRRAVQLAPTNAHAWFELSGTINTRCYRELGFTSAGQYSGDELFKVVTKRTGIDLVRKLEPIHAEAMHCANQAIRFAPERDEFYRERASCRLLNNLLKLRLSAKPIDQSAATAACWSQESLNDWTKAAELSPDNPDAVHSILTYELMRAQYQSPGFSWEEFQTKHQVLIDKTMYQLERISKNTNAPIALAAVRWTLGVLILQSNYTRVAGTCREIVRFDPSAEDAWDTLVSALVVLNRCDEAVREGEKRLQLRDTARNRLVLARAYEAAKRWKEAEAQVRKAFEMEPTNVQANLALAVVLLKEGKLDEARHFIAKIENTTELAPQMAYVQGLYWGMKGMRFMAQTQFKKALEIRSDDERAIEALKVIRDDKTAR